VGLSLERIDEVTSAARLRLSLMHSVALGGTRWARGWSGRGCWMAARFRARS